MPRRNPLAYPAGVAPGFDPGHPLAIGISSGHGFSGYASGNTFINILSGKPGTVASSPLAVIDGIIGPAMNTNSVGSCSFANQLANTDLSITIAVIIVFNTFVNFGGVFSTGSTHGYSLDARTGGALNLIGSLAGSGSGPSSSFSLVTGVPYFLIASGTQGKTGVFSALNLQTGQLLTGANATVIPADATPSNTTIAVGRDQSNLTCNAKISHAMFSPSPVSQSVANFCCADPWSFWYPQTDS